MGLKNGREPTPAAAVCGPPICKPDQLRALHTEIRPQIQSARLRLLAGRLHVLGPRPLFEYLNEVIAGADPIMRLEAYARLAPLTEFIAALDGDRLAPPRVVNGGRQ
jgi:hypothetical protein